MDHLTRLIKIFHREDKGRADFTDGSLILKGSCIGCLACVEICPAYALGFLDTGKIRRIYWSKSKCAKCLICLRICPLEAIDREALLAGKWKPETTDIELVSCLRCGEVAGTEPEFRLLEEKIEGLELQRLCYGCKRKERAEKYSLT